MASRTFYTGTSLKPEAAQSGNLHQFSLTNFEGYSAMTFNFFAKCLRDLLNLISCRGS